MRPWCGHIGGECQRAALLGSACRSDYQAGLCTSTGRWRPFCLWYMLMHGVLHFAHICTAFLLPRAQIFRGTPQNGPGLTLQLWAIPKPHFSILVLACPWRLSLVLDQVLGIFLSLCVGVDCPIFFCPSSVFLRVWRSFGRMTSCMIFWLRSCGDNVQASFLFCLRCHLPLSHYDWVSTGLLLLSLCLASFWLYLEIFWKDFG